MSVVFARLASVFAGSIDFAISENSDEAMSRDRKRHETERREETRAALPLSLFLAPNRQYRRATPLDSELLQRRPRILLRSGPRNGCPDSRSWSVCLGNEDMIRCSSHAFAEPRACTNNGRAKIVAWLRHSNPFGSAEYGRSAK
ncbi:hypothetical protein KCU99_g11, partial [Aureobasidium melanogenum]